MKYTLPNLEDFVVKEQVKCISFNDLMVKHRVKRIDLLLIDTEGYDYQILKQVDLSASQPGLLLFEHEYIDKAKRNECDSRLRDQGYKLSRHFGNTLAYKGF